MARVRVWLAAWCVLSGATVFAQGSQDLYGSSWSKVTAIAGIRKYINSFTSYQIPNNTNPGHDPISRLEWPWEQLYWTGRVGWAAQGFGVNFEYGATLDAFSNLKAQDSDWLDEDSPGQKTTFSEGKANPRGWTFDVNLAVSLPVPGDGPKIQFLLGRRLQQLRFTYADVLQADLFDDENGVYLPQAVFDFTPGESILFSQYFKQWYIGGVVETSVGSALLPMIGTAQFDVRFQGDYGLVKANNFDHHLQRIPPPLFLRQETAGASWHVALGTSVTVRNVLTLDVQGDFMRIWTKGLSDVFNAGAGVAWVGARVWSEQKWISLLLIASHSAFEREARVWSEQKWISLSGAVSF